MTDEQTEELLRILREISESLKVIRDRGDNEYQLSRIADVLEEAAGWSQDEEQ